MARRLGRATLSVHVRIERGCILTKIFDGTKAIIGQLTSSDSDLGVYLLALMNRFQLVKVRNRRWPGMPDDHRESQNPGA